MAFTRITPTPVLHAALYDSPPVDFFRRFGFLILPFSSGAISQGPPTLSYKAYGTPQH